MSSVFPAVPIAETGLTFANNSTGDATSTKHGLLKILPGDPLKVLAGGTSQTWIYVAELLHNISASTTVTASVVNTTETALDTYTLPGGTMVAGTSLKIRLMGRLTKTGIGSPSLDLRFRYGGITGTVLLDTGAVSSNNAQTNELVCFDIDITCITAGATGTIWVTGVLTYPGNAVAGTVTPYGVNAAGSIQGVNSATITVDTTTNNDLVLSAQYGGNTAGNSITIDQTQVIKLN